MTFDLVLRGGMALNHRGMLVLADVAIRSGQIAEVAYDGRLLGAEVADCTGCIITPGLVDLHAHLFEGVGDGVSADIACESAGVTTAVDGGSAGWQTLPAFRGIVSSSRTRVLAWLNLSSIGLIDTRFGELLPAPYLDVTGAVRAAVENRGFVVGLKARLSTYAAGGSSSDVLTALVRAATAAGLPVMVHVGDTDRPLPELVDHLRPGDVVTHAFTGKANGILDHRGRVHPSLVRAQEAGVVFDSGRGRPHLSFDVLRRAVDQDFLPDTISTDVSRPLLQLIPEFNLLDAATYLLALGVPAVDVVTRISVTPARVIKHIDVPGVIAPGEIADLTVIKLDSTPRTFVDSEGAGLDAAECLRPSAVVRRGSISRPWAPGT